VNGGATKIPQSVELPVKVMVIEEVVRISGVHIDTERLYMFGQASRRLHHWWAPLVSESYTTDPILEEEVRSLFVDGLRKAKNVDVTRVNQEAVDFVPNLRRQCHERAKTCRDLGGDW